MKKMTAQELSAKWMAAFNEVNAMTVDELRAEVVRLAETDYGFVGLAATCVLINEVICQTVICQTAKRGRK